MANKKGLTLHGQAYLAQRKLAWERDGKKCVWCGKTLTIYEAEMDHIKLRKMGGGERDDSLENLRTLCNRCHHKRHNG
jgi:5-methylcytosine-specific restriction endonuclease McrA